MTKQLETLQAKYKENNVFVLGYDKGGWNVKPPKTIYKYNQKTFEEYNKEGRGVYQAVNGFNATKEEMLEYAKNKAIESNQIWNGKPVATKRNKDFLKEFRFVFADIDFYKEGDSIDDKKRKISNFLKAASDKIDTSEIVETKNGLQLKIAIKGSPEPSDENKKKYKNISNGIIQWSKDYGSLGDEVKDVTRIARVPGFNHVKSDPFMCNIIVQNSTEYTLDELIAIFPYKDIKKVKNALKHNNKGSNINNYSSQNSSNYKLTPVDYEIKALDIKDVVVRVFGVVGRTASFDNTGRLILDGRLTGTFQGKEGDCDYLASTSHEPFVGNKTTVTAQILNCTNSDARKWIIQEFNLNNNILDQNKSNNDDKKDVVQNIEKVLKGNENKAYIDPIDQIKENPLTWGTDNLNKIITPIDNHHFIVFTGESGSGKTTFTYFMAIENAKLGHKVLYISLEMTKEQLLTRIARDEAKITKEQWRSKSFSKEQDVLYRKKKDEINSIKDLQVIGFPKGTSSRIEDIEGIIEEVKPDMVFIDNLDLIEKKHKMNQLENEENIARNFLNMTNELQIPIILIHHLKKSLTKTEGPRGLESVKGSSKIVHDADTVIMGYRDKPNEESSREEKARFTLIQIKDRDFGIGGNQTVYFENGRFVDNLSGIPNRENFEKIIKSI